MLSASLSLPISIECEKLRTPPYHVPSEFVCLRSGQKFCANGYPYIVLKMRKRLPFVAVSFVGGGNEKETFQNHFYSMNIGNCRGAYLSLCKVKKNSYNLYSAKHDRIETRTRAAKTCNTFNGFAIRFNCGQAKCRKFMCWISKWFNSFYEIDSRIHMNDQS